MTKQEREQLIAIRNGLKTAHSKMPAQAEYVQGVANQGAGGAMEVAIAALDAMIEPAEEDEALVVPAS